MGDIKRVIVSHDLTEFFHNEVTCARADLGVSLNETTEFYLVNLLCDFSRRDKKNITPGEEPLAFMYKRAREANPTERVVLLKDLGDVALYMSGFFTDFIERSLVDVDYYISMGGTAYSDLSGLVGAQRHGGTFAEMYNQLAVRFTELVDILNQISDRSAKNSDADKDLLKLYDRWTRTGSERIRKLLLAKGLLTAPGLPTEFNQ